MTFRVASFQVIFSRENGRAQEILGEAAAAFDVVGGDGFLPGVEAEAAVFPGEELAGFLFADELFAQQGVEEAVAEEFGERLDGFDGHEVEAAFAVDEPGGGEDVEVGVEDEVVAEGLHGGDGGELAVGEVEAGAHPVAEALDGDVEEVVEELAAFAEDAAQGPGHGEDELAVRDVEADGVGDPVAGAADAALVAAGAEVAGLAGEGEEFFVAAVGALEAGVERAVTRTADPTAKDATVLLATGLLKMAKVWREDPDGAVESIW